MERRMGITTEDMEHTEAGTLNRGRRSRENGTGKGRAADRRSRSSGVGVGGVLVLLMLWVLAGPAAGAAEAPQEPLVTLEHRVLGTQLRVTPALVSVPKGIAGSVRVDLVRGDGSAESPDSTLASSAYVEAVLRGPSFPARRLVGRPGEPLLLPALSLVGDYQLDGIRLVDASSGATRLDGTPSSVKVQVFDEVLVSRVTTRPLSMQEITERGIVVDANNFRAVEFEVGFVLDGRTIAVKFPVVAPDFRQSTEIVPEAEVAKRLVEAQRINQELSQAVLESGELPPELQRPGLNIQIRGIHFERVSDADSNLKLAIPPIPALLVVPGNIGYLNQFFSVQVFTENAAPANSGLSVFNVQAALSLPPGPDGIRSTNYTAPGDDPLRFARVGPDAATHGELPVLGPAPTRLARFQPGQGGSAEFLVEGLQEGFHALDLDLTADLDGLAAGTVRVRGKAAGAVLVRNPKFSLSFSHPKAVRSGEPYMAYATVLNTSGVEANLVGVTLRAASLSGGVLETPETVALGTLAPGQSATAAFRVRAQRTGAVRFSNLTTGEASVQGRFNLTLAVDERGVELSPDAIGMPEFVQDLPEGIQVAANRVLGQALGTATAPILPAGVKAVSRAIITRRVLELAEAGQRLRYGDAHATVLLDLLLDWQGGRSADEGFEQIVRETDAGREWRAALMSAIEAADGANAAARLQAGAAGFAGRAEAWWLAASASPGLEVVSPGASGEANGTNSTVGGRAVYRGTSGSLLASRGAAPGLIRFRAVEPVGTSTVVVLGVGTNGTAMEWRWSTDPLAAGGCYTFDPGQPGAGLVRDETCDGVPDGALAGDPLMVNEASPEIVAVLQDTRVSLARPYYRCTSGPANNYGNVLAVLFSKPMSQDAANVPSAFRLDGGIEGAGVQVQPGGRVALVSLREAISVIRPRQLTVSGIQDARGNPVVSQPKPVLTEFRDGVSMVGRVLRADGSVAAGVPVTVTYYDPWKDPFDRCDPVITTRIAQKYTDADGAFSVDFVHGSVGFTVSAVDTGGLSVEAVRAILDATVGDRFAAEKLAALAAATNALAALGVETLEEATQFVEGLDRAVWRDSIPLDSGRIGHEMTIGLRFRGRGMVTGRVFGPDGATPVQGAAVNLFPDPDSRELVRGVFSDAEGRFQFRGVPLGVFSVQVKSPLGHFRTVSGSLARVRETQEVDIVLTAPDSRERQRTTLAGRVVEPADQSGHDGARVFLQHTEIGAIAALDADASGHWTASDVPAGRYVVRAFSRDGRRQGSTLGEAVTGATAFVAVTLNGTGVVVGRVETSAGIPVANALVAGGDALVRTGADGRFRLTGVPLGVATISAGLEGHLAPGGFPRLGSASVQVVAGLDSFVVVRFRPAAMITGRVVDANGAPVPRVKVAVPLPPEGFAWVEADGLGRFVLPNLTPREYVVSAPAPPVTEDPEEILDEAMARSEEEVLAAVQRAASSISTTLVRRYGDAPLVPSGAFGFTRVVLRGDGDVVEANIQYLPNGTVNGTVVNDQAVPIGARVRLTGLGLDEFGQPATVLIGDRDSDPATGEFRIGGLPQGAWALQAANPFYPVVIVTNGLTTRDALNVSNVVLQFPPRRETNGRLVGQVLNPDGSAAGAGVRVKIDFSDDYEIRTDDEGRFDTQITVPARSYRVEAIDPGTGLRGEARVNVIAGLTNAVAVSLLGKGSLVVRVRQADDSPARDALVRVDQSTYPGEDFNGTTDSAGELRLDNLFAGRFGVQAKLLTGAATLEARGGVDVVAGETRVVTLTLGPTGTLRGVFRRLSDGAPVAFARVNVGNTVYPTTDAGGRFEVSGLKLGTYQVSAREPVSGRLATATVVLSVDGQVVDVSLVELPQGVLRGTVFQAGVSGPVAGAEVRLVPRDGLSPIRSVTTGPDGGYEFPGMTPGKYLVQASRSHGPGENYSVTVERDFPSTGADQTQDLTLPRRNIYGRVTVRVLEPGGSQPATAATVQGRGTDPDGRVVFDGLRLGPQVFTARATRPSETSSAARGTVTLTESETNLVLTLELSGVGRVTGRVLQSDGAQPAAGAEVRVEAANRDLGVEVHASVLADDQGRYTLGNLPLGGFRVSAIQGALAASESGTVGSGGDEVTVNLRLGASGLVVGRLVRADGSTAVTNTAVTLNFAAPSGLDGMAAAVTDSDGRFEFGEIPVGLVLFEAGVPAVQGLALARGELTANGETLDLGDVRLDEAWPEVTQVTPEPGASGVAVDAAIRLRFSEPMATNSIRADGIYLRSPTNLVPAELVWEEVEAMGARVVLVRPRQPLSSEVTHRVTVLAGTVEDGLGSVLGKGPEDLVGRPLLALFTSSFTTRDAAAPVLVSVFPTNGAVQVDPRASMRWSFSEPVRETGFVVSLSGPEGLVPGAASVGFGGQVLAFTPSQVLRPNAVYTLEASGILDLAGNPLAGEPVRVTFQTLDTLGPEIATLRVSDGRRPVAGTRVELESLLSVDEPGVTVRYAADGVPVGEAAVAPFRVPLVLPETGVVRLRAIATDRFGNDGPVAELALAVVANEAPTVQLLKGAPGNVPVPTGTPFAFTVSAGDDVAVTNLMVVVTGPTNVVRVFGDGSATNLQFVVPADAVAPDSVEVRARATDSQGAVSTEALIQWPVLDGTTPVAELVGPTNGATLSLDAPLELVLRLRDNSTNVQVRVITAGGLVQTNVFELALEPNVVGTNRVSVPLAGAARSGASLAVSVTVADGAGNAQTLAATYRLPDVEAPRLVSVTPPAGAQRLGLWGVQREFEFSEPLAEASLTTNLFRTLHDGADPTPVILGASGNTVRLAFGSPLRPGATYTNALLPGIVDRAGNGLVDAQGGSLPEGTNLVFTTAAVLSVSPTNDTPVLGGDLLRVEVEYERGLGARYFRFALNDGVPVETFESSSATNTSAEFRIPLDTTNLVVSITASDTATFARPLALEPLRLRFEGNRVTNQPPAIQLVRVTPPSGPVAVGATFTFWIAATDDFGVTNLALTVTGPVSTNAVFGSGARRDFALQVPADAAPEVPVTLSVVAVDTQGAVSVEEVSIPLLALRYPFAEGTLFYSRGPASAATIWAVDGGGGTEIQITAGSVPQISPDGRYLAFRRTTLNDVNRGDLHVRDLATGEERRIVAEAGQGIVGHDWLPDSGGLLFDIGSWIDRIDRNGSNRVHFLGLNGWDDAPGVNRIDGRVAYHNNLTTTTGGLFLVGGDGAGAARIPNTGYGDLFPSWSPDGEWLVFLRDGNLHKIRPDGYDRTQLTFLPQGSGFTQVPAWDADGARVFAAGTVGGTNALWSVGADGGELVVFRREEGVNYGYLGRVLGPTRMGEAPSFRGMSPAFGSTGVSLWSTNLVLAFNRALRTNVAELVTFAPGAASVTPAGSRVILKPELPLSPGVTYGVALGEGATDLRGQAVPPTQGVFTTAGILQVSPAPDSEIRGGQFLDVAVAFEPGLGARFFRFALNASAPVEVEVPTNATRASAQLLVPLAAGDSTVRITASDLPGFDRPYVFEPVPLRFLGNSGTNEPPQVALARVTPSVDTVLPGASVSARASVYSVFGITNVTLRVSGAVSWVRQYDHAGPHGVTFEVPADALPGASILVEAEATDRLGVRRTALPLSFMVGASPQLPPSGTIFYSRARGTDATTGTVWAVGLDGSNDRYLAPGIHPRLSPDNRRLLVGRDKANPLQKNIHALDLLTGQESLLFSHGDYVVFYDWMPDMLQVVADYQCEIQVMSPDGTARRRALAGNCYDDAPAVNPVDGRVAFQNDRADNGLWITAPDFSGRTLVPNTRPGDAWPQWSPDGTMLAFVRTGNVHRVRVDGADLTRLTSLAAGAYGDGPPVWLPDGGGVVFAATVDGTNGVYSAPADGSGTLLRIPTTEGDPIRFVGSVARPPSVLSPPPVLLSVTPVANATRQPVWPGEVSWVFSEALDPATVLPDRFRWSDATGADVPFTLALASNRVVLRATTALQPGMAYTNRLLPGLRDVDSRPAVLAGQVLIPEQGAPFAFTTARVLSVTPTNGAPVVAGRDITVSVTFESPLGAGWFRVGWEGQSLSAVAIPAGSDRFSTTLAVPPDATAAVLRIEASDEAVGGRTIQLAPVTLALTPLGSDLDLDAPAVVQVGQGAATNVVVRATAGSPLVRLGVASGWVPPAFLSVTPAAITNTATSGAGSLTVRIDGALAIPGDYIVPLEARSAKPSAANAEMQVTILEDGTFTVTRWKDPVSGNWGDAARWTAGVPGLGLPAVIEVAGDYTVTVNQDATVGSLRLGSTLGTPVLAIGNRTLRVERGAVIGTNAVLRVGASSTLAGAGFVALNGLLDWDGGTLAAGGELIVGPSGQVFLEGTPDRSLRRTLVNFGRVQWGGGRLFLQSGAEVGLVLNQAGGEFILEGERSLLNGAFWNGGVLRKTAAGTAAISAAITNAATVEVQAGTLEFRASSWNEQRIEVSTNATLLLSGSQHRMTADAVVAGDGAGTVQSSATLDTWGSWTIRGQTLVAGTARFQGLARPEVRRLRLTGTLGGTAVLTVTESFDWISGSLEAGGILILAQDVVGRIDGGADKGWYRQLRNEGRLDWVNGRIFAQSGTDVGMLENLGTFALLGDQPWHNGSMLNRGEIVKPGEARDPGLFYSTVGADLVNEGTVRVASGGLRLGGSGVHRGLLEVTEGAAVRFSAGTRFEPGSRVQGGGDAAFTAGASDLAGEWALGGRLTVEGTVRFQNFAGMEVPTLLLQGGTVGGAGPVTVRRLFEWAGGTLDAGGVLSIAESAEGLLRTSDRTLQRTLENRGVLRWTGGATHGQGILLNRAGASLRIESDAPWYDGSVVNDGELRKVSGTGTTTFWSEVQNRGEVRAESGTLALRGFSRHRGTFSIAPAGALLFGSGAQHVAGAGTVIAGGGRLVIADSAQFRAEGGAVVDASLTVAGGTARFLAGSVLEARDRTLRVEGTIYFDTGAPMAVRSLELSGNLHGADTLEVSGALRWTTGLMSGEGVTVVLPAAQLVLSGGDRSLYRTLVQQGQGLWLSGSMYNNAPGLLRVDPGAELEIQANGQFNSGTLRNFGAVRRTESAQALDVYARVENVGLVRIESGSLNFLSGGAHSGRVETGVSTRFRIAGTHQFAAGAEVSGPGRFEQAGTTEFLGRFDVGGVTRVEGTLEFKPGAEVLLATRSLEVTGTLRLNTGTTLRVGSLALEGTLGGSDVLQVTDALDWSGGIMRDAGTTELLAGGTLTLRGYDKSLHRLLRMAGAGTWTAGTLYASTEGRLRVEGNLEMRGAMGINSGALEVPPSGVFVRTEGTGTASFSQVLNAGRFELQSGTVALFGGMTNSGTLHLGVGATLQADRNVVSLQPGTVLEGAGTLRLHGTSRLDLGTDVALGALGLLLEGSSTVSGNHELSNGTGGWIAVDHSLSFPGSLRVGGELRVLGEATVVTVSRVLTLLAGGSIVNEGTLRAGRFDREDGSGYEGSLPVVLGLPGSLAAPVIREIGFTRAGVQPMGFGAADAVVAVLGWEGPPGQAGGYLVEVSGDLQAWWLAWDAEVREIEPGRYQGWIPGVGGERLFFRVMTP